MTAAGVFFVTKALVGFGILVSTYEWFLLTPYMSSGGLFDSRVRYAGLGAVLQSVNWDGPFKLTLAIRLVASIGLIVSYSISFAGMALLALVLTTAALTHRAPFGTDGSDQMALIVVVSLFAMALWGPNSLIGTMAIVFVCVQAVLSYFVAGVAKLPGPFWRNGTALTLIMSTESYGHAGAARLLHRHPLKAKLLTWGMVLWEVTFPLALFNIDLMKCYLLVAFIFHLSTAVFMGLNSFLWSFVAAFPSVLFTARLIARSLQAGQHDSWLLY